MYMYVGRDIHKNAESIIPKENLTLFENHIWNLPIFYWDELQIILHKFFLFDHINIFYRESIINYRLLFKKLNFSIALIT